MNQPDSSTWTDIITAAAASPLGIVALVVLVISSLAFVFFKSAPIRIRLTVFLILVLVGTGFGASAIMNSTRTSDELTDEPPSETVTTAPRPWEDAKYDLARKNLTWIFENDGARSTYEAAIRDGSSKFDAALQAQRHDDGAYNSIDAMGKSLVEQYISEVWGG